MCYVDDVVIPTLTLEYHKERLDEVFTCVKFQGRLVEKHGVRLDPEAVEAVLTWKAPKTDTQLLSFFEFANIIENSSRDTPKKYTPCSGW